MDSSRILPSQKSVVVGTIKTSSLRWKKRYGRTESILNGSVDMLLKDTYILLSRGTKTDGSPQPFLASLKPTTQINDIKELSLGHGKHRHQESLIIA